jgi:anti-sigma B factor antagonist
MNLTTTEHLIRVVEVHIDERIDAFTVPHLRARLDELLAAGVCHFIIDLSAVPFIDSAGLAALVNLLKRARQAGGDARLVVPQDEAARRILHLTKFDRVFALFETVEQALVHAAPTLATP